MNLKFITDLRPGEIFWRVTPNYIKVVRLHPFNNYLPDDTRLQFDILDKITHKRVLVIPWTCNGDSLQDFEQKWQLWEEGEIKE